MKKRFLLIPMFILILIFTLIPVSALSADPVNLIKNSDFSGGSSDWNIIWGTPVFDNIVVLVGPGAQEGVGQDIYTSIKNLKFSFDVNPSTYGIGNDVPYPPGLYPGFELYDGVNSLGEAWFY